MTVESNAYVVFGSTGEYSDHMYWPVAVYAFKEHGEYHVMRANEWCFDNKVAPKNIDEGEDRYYNLDLTNPWDDGFHVDYTGTEYSLQEIPIGGAYPRPAQ